MVYGQLCPLIKPTRQSYLTQVVTPCNYWQCTGCNNCLQLYKTVGAALAAYKQAMVIYKQAIRQAYANYIAHQVNQVITNYKATNYKALAAITANLNITLAVLPPSNKW